MLMTYMSRAFYKTGGECYYLPSDTSLTFSLVKLMFVGKRPFPWKTKIGKTTHKLQNKTWRHINLTQPIDDIV